jgi:hypothetical protein
MMLHTSECPIGWKDRYIDLPNSGNIISTSDPLPVALGVNPVRDEDMSSHRAAVLADFEHL